MEVGGTLRIGRPRLSDSDGRSTYEVAVESEGFPDSLWFAVDTEFGHLLTDLSDAALVGLLVPAMARGRRISIEGTVSERLLYNVTGPLQGLLLSSDPFLHEVAVEAGSQHVGSRSAGVALGFSGGIDSFDALIDHHYSSTALPGFRITHLLTNNVGGHGCGPAARQLFVDRYRRLEHMVERIGVPFVRVDSNLDDFYRDLAGQLATFLSSHPLRNTAAAMVLQNGLGRLLYSGARTYQQLTLADVGVVPILLPLISTEAFESIATGYHRSRVEKTLRVAQQPDSYAVLDVCMEPPAGGGNCSRCDKCMRTQVTLEMAGFLDRYREVFDTDNYQRMRTWYLGEVLHSDDIYAAEIRDLAKEREFRYPIASRLRAIAKPVLGPLIGGLRRLARRAR